MILRERKVEHKKSRSSDKSRIIRIFSFNIRKVPPT